MVAVVAAVVLQQVQVVQVEVLLEEIVQMVHQPMVAAEYILVAVAVAVLLLRQMDLMGLLEVQE
jgi:hypothetical protein